MTREKHGSHKVGELEDIGTFLDGAGLDEDVRGKIAHGNAERLLRL